MTPALDSRLFFGKEVRVIIDRPKGSKHPTFGDIYPVNYGHIPETKSGDGEELDAYILGIDTPLKEFRGICIAIIHRTNDDDDKLVIAPSGMNFTDEDIRAQTHFQEQYFKSVIWRK